jgi:fimbrial chaperone protein
MRSAHLKILSFLAIAVSMLLSSALPAAAGAFNVKPIRVFLSKDGTSTVVTIENQDRNVLRLQVRAYAWTNDVHGQPVLVPTDDLLVLPTLVDINPMEHRSIRVGFSGPASAKELTYRIALDEMPSIESQLSKARAPGLQVRTRVTIPVFFTPLISSPKAEIEALGIDRGTLQGRVTNDGNVHATVSTVEVTGRDARGAKVFEKQINGWYVLPGEAWDFQAALGHSCAKVKTLSVTVQSDAGRFDRTLDVSPASCK